jgi:hypothetical protein
LGQRKRAMKNSLAEMFVSLLSFPFKVLWWILTLPFKLAWWIISLPFKLLFGGSKKKKKKKHK